MVRLCDNSAMSTFSQSWYRNLCGLLPVTQPPNGDRTALDGVRQDTKEVTEYIIAEFVNPTNSPIRSSMRNVCDTMRTLVTQVMESDGRRFQMLVEEMEMGKLRRSPHVVVNAVLDSMFEDGRIHWLRIVAAYVYAVKLAVRCDSEKQPEGLGESVVRSVGDYLCGETLALWIHSQGGWKNITTVFVDPNDLEQKLKSAGYLALAVGFGALLSVVTSR